MLCALSTKKHRCNNTIISWLTVSMSPAIANSVLRMKSAIDVWRNLAKISSRPFPNAARSTVLRCSPSQPANLPEHTEDELAYFKVFKDTDKRKKRTTDSGEKSALNSVEEGKCSKEIKMIGYSR